MNQKLIKRPIRRTIDLDQELHTEIYEIEKSKNWSFSFTVYMLLKQAVKEKNRKKKSSKKDGGS
jgi:hypothetical protein